MNNKEEKDMLRKALDKCQIERVCKYQLPCGICDRTGYMCRDVGVKHE